MVRLAAISEWTAAAAKLIMRESIAPVSEKVGDLSVAIFLGYY